MDWKLELVAIPVSDVDRAKAFYERVGFNADHDHQVSDEIRFVQLTPPGSACSIALGNGVSDMEPGSMRGLQVVVDDADAARAHLAVQAQDARGARLAVRARSASTHASDLDRALTDERSLVITWVNRGTLHLVAAEDEPVLHAMTTPQLRTGSDRRLAQEGVSPAALDRGIDAIVAALGAEGPMTRDRLRGVLDAIGVPTARQALVHILYRATLDGLIVRGPMVGSEHAFVLRADWLGERPPVDRDRALAELARRYLVGHGPADARDLAKWAQLPLRDARAGLGAIASELRERAD